MLSLSLGATNCGPPSTWRGRIVNAAAAPAVFSKNLRRSISDEDIEHLQKEFVAHALACSGELQFAVLSAEADKGSEPLVREHEPDHQHATRAQQPGDGRFHRRPQQPGARGI